MRVWVISDTHGYFNPKIPELFAGVEHIIHAGDVGNPDVLQRLRALAPVTAVTGNVDWGGPLDRELRRNVMVELGGCRIFVTHIGDEPSRLVERLPEPRPQVYIYGHSHIAHLETRDGVLFLNPGAAGRPRFGRGASLALLETGDPPGVELISL
jgi:uncharacterized protein